MLQHVYSEDMKIITIENPIEYKVKGIVQTQVDETSVGAGGNYTFGSAMRAILRQDPDVIMVGEIRDAETADTAINAALTGHLVFSTLHTNTAAGAIPRLIGMQVNPKILGSSLTLSLAQRLMRTICKSCKVDYEATEEEKKLIDRIYDEYMEAEAKQEFLKEFAKDGDIKNKANFYKLKKGLGCKECNGYGYKGRMAVHEGIIMSKEIEEIAATNPSEREIQKAAGKQGFLTLREDAMLKVWRGITTVEESLKNVDMYGAEVDRQPAVEDKNFK
jgi:type IV pilus assembly protein PilB